MLRMMVIAAATLCVACVPPAGTGGSPEGSAESADTDNGGGERFFGRERFTLVGTQSGTESGSFTEYVRDWGRTRAEIKNTTIAVMGITRRTNARVVYSGPEIATIDLDTGAVTLATNPMYSQVVEAMRGRDGIEFGQEIMTQMGGRATGETGSYAGHQCAVWEVAQLGSRSCVTDWGATLHNSTTFGGVTMERTVTEVRMNDGGPDDAFQYDASAATRAPSLEDIRAKMKGQ